MPGKEEAKGETTELTIWVHLADLDARDFQLASSAYVSNLFAAIRAHFNFSSWNQLIVQTKDADGNLHLLADAKLTLAEALKCNSKGYYEVYVKVPKGAWLQALDSPLPLAQINVGLEVSATETKPVGHYVQRLTRWGSFAKEASSLTPSDPQDWTKIQYTPAPFSRKAEVLSAVTVNVGRFVSPSKIGRISFAPRADPTEQHGKRKHSAQEETKQEEQQQSTQRVPLRHWMARGEPDLVGLDPNSCVVGVIEAKTPWSVVDLDDVELVAKYNEREIGDNSPTLSAIAQTIGYMMDNDTRYGALTTYNTTRFFRAVSFDHVEVSDAVRADSLTSEEHATVTLRRAFVYWLSLCCGPTSFFTYNVPRRVTP